MTTGNSVLNLQKNELTPVIRQRNNYLRSSALVRIFIKGFGTFFRRFRHFGTLSRHFRSLETLFWHFYIFTRHFKTF